MNVILCYNVEDGDQAGTLCNHLKTFGMTLWLDQDEIKDENEWKQRISQAITDRSFILYLLSTYAFSKTDHFRKKLGIAKKLSEEIPDAKDYMLFVRLDDCRLPDNGAAQIQHVDLFPSYEDGFRGILHFFVTEDRVNDSLVGKSVIDARRSSEENHKYGMAQDSRVSSPDVSAILRSHLASSPQTKSKQLPTKTVYKSSSRLQEQPLENFLGRVDRYQLIEKLGSGGYGAVFRARDTVANIDIALKILPHLLTNNKEELEDIRRNFSLVSRLRHQNIATLLHLHEVLETDAKADQELGLIPGHYLTVMEYVPGVTIKTYLKQHDRRKVGVKESLDLCLAIAEVLDYAHSKKIVHRDIKPSNIMLTPDKEIKVLDFGLAAEIRSSMSRVSKNTTAITGTFPYMSPEQWQGKRLNGRSDQYALAVLFHELISSEVPFSGIFTTSDSRLMRETVLTQTPDGLPELSRKQNKILHRALAKDPQERYGSCQDFISDLVKNMPNKKAMLIRQIVFGILLVLMITAITTFSIIHISTSHELKLVTPVKIKVEEKINDLHTLDQGQGIATVLEDIDKIVEQADRLLKEKDLKASLSLYNQALDQCLQVERIDEERESARQTNAVVLKAKSKAELANGDIHAEDLWGEAITLLGSGTNHFESGDFDTANKEWQKATEVFRNAETQANYVERILTAKAEYEDKLASVDKRLLKEFGADRWGQIQGLVSEAEALWDEKLLKDSALLWERVSKLTSQVVQSVMSEESLKQTRQLAEQAQSESEKAKTIAESFKASRYASTYWLEGISLTKTAEKLFQSEDFIPARKKWELATAQFKLAESYSEQIRRLLQAKSKYKSILSKIDEKKVYDHSGDEWEQTMLVVVEAEEFERQGKFNAALSKWDEASRLLSKVKKLLENSPQSETLSGNLEQAEQAKSKGGWQEVLNYSKKELTINPDSKKAKALLEAASEQLVPKLNIVSIIDDKVVEGAKISINNLVLGQRTPAAVKVELNKEYVIKVEFPDDGQKRLKPFETIYVPKRSGTQTLRAVLKKMEGPIIGQSWLLPGIKMKFLPIKENSFKMGSNVGDDDEKPIHSVIITAPFWIGKYEVTQGEYHEIIGRNLSPSTDPQNPMQNLSWYDAVDFCDRLTEIEKENGRLPPDYVYRLPTEAEWEFCCRAGTNTEFSFGNVLDWTMANFNGKYPYGNGEKGKYRKHTLPVDSFEPNPWGIHNMHGNVWEWCLDKADWDSGVITETFQEGIKDPFNTTGQYRIIRGGNFRSFAGNCRSGNRHVLRPSSRNDGLGFRVILGPDI